MQSQIAVRERSDAAWPLVLETIDESRFLMAKIEGSSKVQSGLTTVTISMQTNVYVRSSISDDNFPGASSFSTEPRTVILVQGLLGSLTPSGSLPVTGPYRHLFYNSSTLWNQSTGVLMFEINDGMGIPADQVATWSIELRNPTNMTPPANATIRVTGPMQVPPRGESERLVGEVLHVVHEPAFDYLFVNYSSTVMGGQSKVSLHLRPNAIIEPLQNITIGGLRGSETPVTEELQLQGPDASVFTSSFYMNLTNYSHGVVHNGSIIYRRTEVHLSLDRSAPTIEDIYVGMYITVGNESRTIVAYR